MSSGKQKAAKDKIARLEEQIALKLASLHRARARIREKAKKAKSRNLMEIGRLAEMAGISGVSPGAILGGMMELADLFENKMTYKRLKKIGDSRLAYAKRKAKKRAANE